MADTNGRSFLQYLPAVFHKPPAVNTTEITLREYLAPFETVFQEFDELLSTLDRYVAPQLTPRDEFLPWLASWVALVLETGWDESLQRRVIEEAVELYRWRGTVYGLKRYLQLYAEIPEDLIEIEEASWPAGMQIGVASRIGEAQPVTANAPMSASEVEQTPHDAYVVDTLTTAAPVQPIRVYYQSDQVVKINLEAEGVRVWYRAKAGAAPLEYFHAKPTANEHALPNIAFHGGRVDYRYRLTRPDQPAPAAVDYYGGAFLIDRVALPYRFIVHIKLPAAELQKEIDDVRDKKLMRIRRILDLEKPAHTEYYLKLSPVMDAIPLQWMQIEVRSSIGLDTLVG